MRWSAGMLIALVLCPFTAPYASYDPNAMPIGVEDGALPDTAHAKDVTVLVGPLATPDVIELAPVCSILNVLSAVDLSTIHLVVLRI